MLLQHSENIIKAVEYFRLVKFTHYPSFNVSKFSPLTRFLQDKNQCICKILELMRSVNLAN